MAAAAIGPNPGEVPDEGGSVADARWVYELYCCVPKALVIRTVAPWMLM